MAGSLNKVMIIGNLGADPEIRHTGDGRAVANLTVATNERWKSRDGDQQERTEWHKVVAFGKLAEIIEKYMKKGSNAYFEGRIQTRKWQDKEGQDRYTTEIVADQMTMLGGGSGGGGNYSSNQSSASSSSSSMKPTPVTEDTPFDDEIPF